MLNGHAPAEFAPLMGQVARALLGEPNKRLSSASEFRYGTKGSLAVDLTAGGFYDHEAKQGGGVLDLVMRERRCDKSGAVRWLTDEGLIEASRGHPTTIASVAQPGGSVFYEYADENGEVIYKVERCATGRVPFLHHGPDGRGGFASSKGCMDGVVRVPYHLPELLGGPTNKLVFLTEGEKDADRLRSLGLVATTNSGGAANFTADLAAHFAGRRVAVLEDNDKAGRDRTATVRPLLEQVGAKVVVVRFDDLPEHGDVSDWLDAGHTKADLIGRVREAASERPKVTTPLPIVWFDDVEPAIDSLWLVKKLLPMTGLALIYGHPGCGKSFFALDLSFHIALGRDWCGLRVEQGLVIYIAAEGQAGLRNRITAFRNVHRLDAGVPFVLIPMAIDLHDPAADTGKLIETVRAAEKQAGMKAALVVVDTLSKTMGGGKENTDDMATYVANCGRVASEFQCLVMPVHHRPKDSENSDPRGHGSLRGGVDTIILVEAGAPKRARVTKQKDGEDGDTFRFNLRSIELGIDRDGDQVTSCICEYPSADAAPAADPVAQAQARLSDGQALALRFLGDAIATRGYAVPAEIPGDVINTDKVGKVVALSDWRDMFVAANRTGAGYPADVDPGQGPDKSADTPRRTFGRYVSRLQVLDLVRVWEDHAWLTHEPTKHSRTPPGQVPDTPVASPGQAGHPVYKTGGPVRMVGTGGGNADALASDPIEGWDA